MKSATWIVDFTLIGLSFLVGGSLSLAFKPLIPKSEIVPTSLEIFLHNFFLSVILIVGGKYIAMTVIGLNALIAGFGLSLYFRNSSILEVLGSTVHVPFEVTGWLWTIHVSRLTSEYYSGKRMTSDNGWSWKRIVRLALVGILLYGVAAYLERLFFPK